MKRIVLIASVVGSLMLGMLVWSPSVPHRLPSTSRRSSEKSSTKPTGQASRVVPAGAKLADARIAPVLRRIPPETEPAEFSAFADWAARFLGGAPSATPAQGAALAWKRREAMLELLQRQPQKALSLTVPFSWRQALPVMVSRYFEQQVDGRGSLQVLAAASVAQSAEVTRRFARFGQQRYEAFVYGRRLGEPSQPDLPLHGIALDGKLAVSDEPIRMLIQAEAEALAKARGRPIKEVCSVCGRVTESLPSASTAEIGGELNRFCGVEHAQLVDRHWARLESERSRTLADDGWTHGPKSLLYMRVNFPDDLTEPIGEAEAYDVMDQVNAFYAEGSYNQTTLEATVTPLLSLPQVKAFYAMNNEGPFTLLSDARDVARQAGYDTANYDLDIVCLTPVPTYSWGGLGFVGAKGVWLQSAGAGVTAHELGHNFGLMHANFWDTSTDSSGIGLGTNVEYGNPFDTMGAAAAGNNQFNAFFKNLLDWLPDTTVWTAASNGVVRLYPFDVPTRQNGCFYAVKVRKDFQRDYWLEYRQKFTANPWLENGLLLNWSAWAQSAGGSDLLDASLGTPPFAAELQDAALVVGRTFSDPGAGVHITPIARGATGTNVWLDVQLNLGAFPANQSPEVQLEIEHTNTAPGSLVHFHAVAFDPDGDSLAYAWTFDDRTFSTNNLPWTFKSWGDPGEHVVRCVVSDMHGGVASANALVTVGEPIGYRIAGQVLDTNGVPVEGVRVDNYRMDNPCQYYWGFTDSDGRYLLTGVLCDLELAATKYGFTFTNFTWTNPVVAASNSFHVDFVALPLPVVSVALTNCLVSEKSGSTTFFVLTRTGDITTNLTVTVNLSGTATLGSDFTLLPPLVPGTSSVDFSPDVSSIVFALHVLPDSLVEGPETVTLTLFDDPSYVQGSPGEATLTILDDNAPGLPIVTIAATTPLLPERAVDEGEFVFSRSGKTDRDLIVYFVPGGTATPGVDYTTLAGVVLLPAGQSAASVRFHPLNDNDVEPDETVIVTLKPDAAYAIGNPTAQVTLLDDDLTTVTIFPTDANAAEPSQPGRFTVKRDGDLSSNLAVNYIVGGTATSGLDYVPLTGTVSIPAGSTSTDILLTPRPDNLLEGDESVVLTLVTNRAYNIGTPATATLFIRDDQKPYVTLQAIDAWATEQGFDFGTFEISRGSVVNGSLTVFLGVSGTALNGIDYVPLPSAVVIPDGASTVTLDVIPFDDLLLEPTEEVRLTLLPSTNYNLGAPLEAVVSILDDDPYSLPGAGFSFSKSSALESQSPVISVALSYTSMASVTVNYRVVGGTAWPSNYSLPPGTLIFEPGETVKTVPLAIVDNQMAEPDRTVLLALYDPTNATLDGLKLHTLTIVDDDAASVSVTALPSRISETGQVAGKFRISRTGNTSPSLSVTFQVTGTASAPADYAPLGNSTVIPPGAAFIDLPVLPTDDFTTEHDETVVLTLLAVSGGKVVSPAVATLAISDGDPEARPIVLVTSTNHPSAVEGGRDGEFTLFRTSTNGMLTVLFSLSGTAKSGVDFQPLGTSITFANGQPSVAVPVHALDDSQVEGERTVVLSLSSSPSYRMAFPASALVTVQDNDQRVRLEASDFISSEPGADAGEFTFTRVGSTNANLRVFFSISGTALNGIDYLAISNSVVIPAGSSTLSLPIVPIDDLLVEGPQTVTLTLSAQSGYALDTQAAGTVTLNDDEPMLTLIASVPEVTEGSQTPGVLTIIRTGNPKYEFTAYLGIAGTAQFGVDYPPFTTNVFFSCGVTAIDLFISPQNDLLVEGPETLTAVLLPDPAYTILAPSNALVLIDDAGLNLSPVVTITRPAVDFVLLRGTSAGLVLEATVTDDGPTPPTTWWQQLQGPVPATFGDTNLPITTVLFTNAGAYVIRLTADDGLLQTHADLTVIVGPEIALNPELLYWTLNDGLGTNVLDSSGGRHHGVLSGNPTWTPGVLGGALRFSGTNDLLRTTNAASFLDGLRAFTLSLWLKSETTNADQGVLSAADSSAHPTLALTTRGFASCGQATNVIEASIASTRGMVRRISAAGSLTNGWQHVALAWSNGLPPVFFINSRPDQPDHHTSPLAGRLTNCPAFLVGKGPAEWPFRWLGQVDDVRLYSRALTDVEVSGVGRCCGQPNYGPEVDAGTNQTLQLFMPATLTGWVQDDGLPDPPASLSNTWLQVAGPALVVITNIHTLTNNIEFAQTGIYAFRLTADDGEIKTFDDIVLTVTEPTRVDVFAFDSDAAELGPDPGSFAFIRTGDTNYDLTVFFAFTGIASNGLDFVTLPTSLTFPAGLDTVMLEVRPFLDHRTEGDQDLNLNLQSNRAYTIGNGLATVFIHDSPYGQWTISHFTLEELTQPALSGESADFDGDGLVNLAEYAANLDPKIVETNSPLVVTLEPDPADGQPHIALTYHRRLPPTDVGYAPAVSDDLLTWQTGTNYVREILTTDDGNGLTETVRAQVVSPYSNQTNRFVTVRVWLQVTTP